jgi:hypothetical protein
MGKGLRISNQSYAFGVIRSKRFAVICCKRWGMKVRTIKKAYLLLLALTIVGCGAPQKQVWEDYQSLSDAEHKDSHTVSAEPRFSDDPLLDSVYRARYLECLEKCSKK